MLNRWKGEAVAIIASGPSLTIADAAYARLAARRVIAINHSYKLCPNADVLYAADERWWRSSAPAPEDFTGERWSSSRNEAYRTQGVPAGVRLVTTVQGAKLPIGETIYEGSNSAFQAMQLAVVWGAGRIVFLGLDLQFTGGAMHWHGAHVGGLANPTGVALGTFRKAFEMIAPELAARGIDVVNASRATALDCFRRETITNAIP